MMALKPYIVDFLENAFLKYAYKTYLLSWFEKNELCGIIICHF